MGTTTVQRIWTEADLKSRRLETFRFSTDPESLTGMAGAGCITMGAS